MKRAYAGSSYGRLYERDCRKTYPDEAGRIFRRAEEYYRTFMKDMPDLGKNGMAKNMLDRFTILSFYEASDHRLNGEVLLTLKRREADCLRFLGKLVDGNKAQWPYRLFAQLYVRYDRLQRKHRARGEWIDSGRWKSIPTTAPRASAFIWSAASLPDTPGSTAIPSCCRICAGPITTLPRSCTHGSFAHRRRRWAATAAIIGMLGIKARRLQRMGT